MSAKPTFSASRLNDAASRGDIGAIRAELALRQRRPFPRGLAKAAMLAIANGRAAAAALLLDHGAEFLDGGDEALSMAATLGDLACVDLLLDRGVPPDPPTTHPLLHAVREGRVDVALRLLERGARIDRDHHECYPWFSRDAELDPTTALSIAIQFGNLEMAKLLVERGARQGVGHGLRMAATSDSEEALRALRWTLDLGFGAGPSELAEALVIAALNLNRAAARLLMERGGRLERAKHQSEEIEETLRALLANDGGDGELHRAAPLGRRRRRSRAGE